MAKYGVVNIDTLCRDLSEWNTLYLAGRLQKPVKILRNDPQVLLSNHVSYDNAVAKMGTLKDKKPDQPNPFVVGEDTVDRFLTVLGECALATKAYVEAGQPGKDKKDAPAPAAAVKK